MKFILYSLHYFPLCLFDKEGGEEIFHHGIIVFCKSQWIFTCLAGNIIVNRVLLVKLCLSVLMFIKTTITRWRGVVPSLSLISLNGYLLPLYRKCHGNSAILLTLKLSALMLLKQLEILKYDYLTLRI